MTIEKVDGVWAESGDVDDSELTDNKKASGWVPGDQPTQAKFNHLQNRTDVHLDKLTVERVNSYYDDSADPQRMISSGLWDESWALSQDDINTLTPTTSYVDVNVVFDDDKNPYLVSTDDDVFVLINARTMEITATSDPFTDALPSGGGSETWNNIAMCSDGTYIYVLFQDANASPDDYRVQSWLATDLTVNTSWPATGVDAGSGTIGDAHIIIASDDYLAYTAPWNTITASSIAAINIINISDGSTKTNGTGAGDAPTGSSLTARSLSSDGTNIFFAAIGTSGVHICSATIANAQVGLGAPANYPYNAITTNGDTAKLVSCGTNQIGVLSHTSTLNEVEGVLITFNADNAELDFVNRGQNSATTPINGDKWIFGSQSYAVFDGINLWVSSRIYNTASQNTLNLIKIDVSKLIWADTNVPHQIGDIVTSVFNLGYQGDYGNVIDIAFDGRDIWLNRLDGSTGKLHRFPMAIYRS